MMRCASRPFRLRRYRGAAMMSSSRRGMLLVLVLVSLALAAALITPLAMLSGIEAVAAGRDALALRHRLAAESLVALLPDLLKKERDLEVELDRCNIARLDFEIGQIKIQVLLQD